jgi:1,4-dihydroxy-2-naphthoyl-CoA hydrolase
MLWKFRPSVEFLNSLTPNTLSESLGMEFTEVGDDYLIGRMPVDSRTVQPFRRLHGGASVALAETLGSVASNCCIDVSTKMAVGLEINANHLSAGKEGRDGVVAYVYGKVTCIRVGRAVHVWNIEIKDESERLVCVSRLTMAIIEK